MTTQEDVPYWYPEQKEKPMKYKIDPIPGLPAWFTPGIVCRVRDCVADEWEIPRPIDRCNDSSESRQFEDRDHTEWRFAEPVEQWEPKEGEYVAKFNKPDNDHFSIGPFSRDTAYMHFARLEYPDGRVIDCACSPDELLERTEWI